jgi:multicomponent Na+:H+ antiporter subunit D
MQLPMTAFLIGSLSIIGLPPLGGSWSKWFLALGAAEGGRIGLIAVLMISSLLNIAYLMPIVVRGFFSAPPADEPQNGVQEAPLLCLVPIGVTAVGCIFLFFYAETIYNFLLPVVGG